MGETCLHVPARVLGFNETTSDIGVQAHREGSAQLQRASLLSALLKESRAPVPNVYNMEVSDSESDEDMDMEDDGEEDEDLLDEGGDWVHASSGTAPMPIPSTSEAFLRQQREALKRFVYAHQIEEMRRQCAAYFARQARFAEARPGDNATSTIPPAPTAPVIPHGAAAPARMSHTREHLPCF